MARFIRLLPEEEYAYYLNLETIENVDPVENKVYTISDECYTLNDDDMRRVLAYVNENLYEVPNI